MPRRLAIALIGASGAVGFLIDCRESMFCVIPDVVTCLQSILALIPLVALILWDQLDWIRQRRTAIEAGWIDASLANWRADRRPPQLLGLFGETGYDVLWVWPNRDREKGVAEAQALFPEADIQSAMPGLD